MASRLTRSLSRTIPQPPRRTQSTSGGDTYGGSAYDLKDRLDYYGAILDKLDAASLSHKGWYTHKRENGLYCWICDLLMAANSCHALAEEALKLAKSAQTDMTRGIVKSKPQSGSVD